MATSLVQKVRSIYRFLPADRETDDFIDFILISFLSEKLRVSAISSAACELAGLHLAALTLQKYWCRKSELNLAIQGIFQSCIYLPIPNHLQQ